MSDVLLKKKRKKSKIFNLEKPLLQNSRTQSVNATKVTKYATKQRLQSMTK